MEYRTKKTIQKGKRTLPYSLFPNQQMRIADAIPYATHQGFTIIELLVTIGIFSVLTGAVLANYRSFNTNATFANATEDVVLALRQAQVYGAATKGNTAACGAMGTPFDCAYGVYLSWDPTLKNQIKIFVDKNDNKKYDGTPTDIDVEVIQWSSNIFISDLLCGGTPCVGGASGGAMNVTFKRPVPDAYITDNVAAGAFTTGSIVVKDSNTGKITTIGISSAGQISLQ